VELDRENLVSKLKDSGLPDNIAHHLAELGGGEDARRETGEGSALRMLEEAGTDLRKLDESLRRVDDSGLAIGVSRKVFSRWMGDNDRRLSAVLATKVSPGEEAKARVRSLEPPPEFRFSLDPALPDLLSPVVEALREAGLDTDAQSLADDPAQTLYLLGEFGTVEELDRSVSRLFNAEEQRLFLRKCAAQWQREIRLFAVLAKTERSETPTQIRAHDEYIETVLPRNPSSPADLRDVLGELLGKYPTLVGNIRERLVETVNAIPPNHDQLMEWARQDGVAVDRLDSVEKALRAPHRAHARELGHRFRQLADDGDVRPATPDFLKQIEVVENGGKGDGDIERIPVAAIKVGESFDRRKRELGDEGEQWALAARGAAIDEIGELLGRFEGASTDKALAHTSRAVMPGLDEEELIEELSGLLHVSQYSDAFGFDMVGWLAPRPDAKERAVCLEVKSSSGEGFHLSRGQWSLASKFNSKDIGDRYAVLVVRRAKSGGVPVAMDLLSDPVALEEAGNLQKEADGYKIAYHTDDS
jgi:hypothetical protein